MIVCPHCGKELEQDAQFCIACGKPVSAAKPSVEAVVAPVAEPVSAAETTPVSFSFDWKKLPLKTIAIVAAAIVAAVAIFIGLFQFLASSKKNYAFYLKDGEIVFANLNGRFDPWQVTKHLLDFEEDEMDDYATGGTMFAYFMHVSDDGKTLFYPDKIEEEDEGINLYYRRLDEEGADPVKVSSDVLLYFVNKSTTLVTYMKGEEQALYQYDIKKDEHEKIDGEVEQFYVTDDGNTLLYLDEEYNLYVKKKGADKERIVSEIEKFVYATEDFGTVYYQKDDTLYKHPIGKDKVKIDEDVADVLKVYDSGEIYYTKGEEADLPLADFVEDDMKEADAAIVKPTSPKYPSRYQYDTAEEYQAAYDAYQLAYDEYREAYAAYSEKKDRDELREELEEETVTVSDYTLYYYDAAKSTEVAASFVDGYSSFDVAVDKPVIVYQSYDSAKKPKVKLSLVDNIYTLEDEVEEALTAKRSHAVSVGEKTEKLDIPDTVYALSLQNDGTLLRYLEVEKAGDDYGDLYELSLQGKIGKPMLYDTDVYRYGLGYATDTKFLYYKDFDDEDNEGELYVNKQKIDADVRSSGFSFSKDGDKLYYFTDWDSEDLAGTLKLYQDGKTTTVSDDVHSHSQTATGELLYLYDYSEKYKKGELYVWDGKDAEKIDDDVSCLIPASSRFGIGLDLEFAF